MAKAFIEVEVIKEFSALGEYKVITGSGVEIYVPYADVIPVEPVTGGRSHENLELASFGGSVVINGTFLTASDVKLYLELYKGLLQQYEDLKEAYKKNVGRGGDAIDG